MLLGGLLDLRNFVFSFYDFSTTPLPHCLFPQGFFVRIPKDSCGFPRISRIPLDSFINHDPASEASVALEIIARACFGAARAHQIAGRPCQGRKGARKYCSKMPSLLTWFLNHFALCRFASESYTFMCLHVHHMHLGGCICNDSGKQFGRALR